MAFVVVLPAFVTVCKFGVVPLGQFVPFNKHTGEPFTNTPLAFNSVPEAVLKPSHEVEVPFVNDRFVIVPFVPNKFVVVTLVAVPFANVTLESVVLPTTAKVPVTVELAVKNPPKK
jgi:hypothetical protein